MFRTNDEGQTWTVVEKPPTSAIVSSCGCRTALWLQPVSPESSWSAKTMARALPWTLHRARSSCFDIAEGDDHSLLVAGPKRHQDSDFGKVITTNFGESQWLTHPQTTCR